MLNRAWAAGSGVAMLLVLASCAHPARVSATLDISRRAPDTVLVALRITNLDDGVTTPLAPEVTIQSRTAGVWDKPTTQIQPVAFVLNKHELRNITKVVHTAADLIRARVTVREQESGRILIDQRLEKAVP